MSVPTTRDQFKEFCLRKLGKPVIKINVSPDQVDDRVDEALSYWYEFHADGTEKTYYKYGPVTDADVANRYITLPENIIGAVKVFPVGQALSTNNLFNIRYQIALNDLYDLTNTSMVPYYQAMQHIQFLEQLLVGDQPIRFNRHNNILYIDQDWTMVPVGQYLIVEAYGVVDPDDYADVWNDRWLQRYATALIKKQWGDNPLPGGQRLNGDKIMADAQREIEKLEEEMRTTYSMPPEFFTG
jgi:hypothetical protein